MHTSNKYSHFLLQYDLVCDDSIFLSIAQSCGWIGMVIGLLIGGYLSDKYGRRIIVGSGYICYHDYRILYCGVPEVLYSVHCLSGNLRIGFRYCILNILDVL